MKSLLYLLPKELLIEIIEKQNIAEYYTRADDCYEQIKLLTRRATTLIENRDRKIKENICACFPSGIKIKNANFIFRDVRKLKEEEEEEKQKGKNSYRVSFEFANVNGKIIMSFYLLFIYTKIDEKEVNCKIMLGGEEIENFQFLEQYPELEKLYVYLTSPEFIQLLFSQ